jgi:hypothetical protein
MIDAGNFEQRVEAGLAILAVLDLGEVDGVIELSHRPAKLDVVRLGGRGEIRDKQGRGQQQSNGRGNSIQYPWRHRNSKPFQVRPPRLVERASALAGTYIAMRDFPV